MKQLLFKIAAINYRPDNCITLLNISHYIIVLNMGRFFDHVGHFRLSFTKKYKCCLAKVLKFLSNIM